MKTMNTRESARYIRRGKARRVGEGRTGRREREREISGKIERAREIENRNSGEMESEIRESLNSRKENLEKRR